MIEPENIVRESGYDFDKMHEKYSAMNKQTHILTKALPPILKYPGGKENELRYILPMLPDRIKSYYEPFVGAGAVYLSIDASAYYINDKSFELIRLYAMIKKQDENFFHTLYEIDAAWRAAADIALIHAPYILSLYKKLACSELSTDALKERINAFVKSNDTAFFSLLPHSMRIFPAQFQSGLIERIYDKMCRMKNIEAKKAALSDIDRIKNIEGAFKNALYIYMRRLYNAEKALLADGRISEGFAAAIYVFIRAYCYASMYRYNQSGDFNVPYGGISYNEKSLVKYIYNYQAADLIAKLNKSTISNDDFYDFMTLYAPSAHDFVFLDPPYDSDFSTYAQNAFGASDQMRLAQYLIHTCKANFMLVIKNTPLIRSLYAEGTKTANGGRLSILRFEKRYLVSFHDRNDKRAEHLMIVNYDTAQAQNERGV